MPVVSMTDRLLATLTATGSPVELVDGRTRGLVLRVSPDASVRTWSVSYRSPLTGKKQRLGIGRYPETSLKEARKAAEDALRAVSSGTGPLGERKAAKAKAVIVRMTVADLVSEYITRAAANLRSAAEIERRLRVYVLPDHGATPVAEWHRRDVALTLDRLKVPTKAPRGGRRTKGVGAPRRGGPAIASRVYDDVKAVSAWAVRNGYLEADPMSFLSRPSEPVQRDRVLSHDEIKAVFTRLETAPGMSIEIGRILRLLALTACRVSEIAELRVDEVDFDGAAIRLTGERVKNGRAFVVPLVPEALMIIREALADAEKAAARRAKRASREASNVTYLFPSPRGGGAKPIDGHAPSVSVRRALDYFGTGHFTPHDLRRTAATLMAEVGVQPHIIEVALNHVSGFRAGVAGIYNRAAYQAEHRDALERLAAHFTGIVAGSSKVVAVGTRRA
jgi:integrase